MPLFYWCGVSDVDFVVLDRCGTMSYIQLEKDTRSGGTITKHCYLWALGILGEDCRTVLRLRLK